jgi:hypothetical protein
MQGFFPCLHRARNRTLRQRFSKVSNKLMRESFAHSFALISVFRLSGQVNQKIVDDFPGLLRLFEPRHVPTFVDKRERRVFD